jgi:Protein of unknown function (DUF1631)
MASLSNDGSRPVRISEARRTEILQELAEIATGVANKQLDGFATRLSDALMRVAELCIEPEQGRLHANAAALLKKNRYPFCYIAAERIATVLQDEIRLACDPAFKPDTSAGSFKPLEPDVEVDKKLCLIKAARAVEREHAERLAALASRLAGVLGRDEVSTAQNPFRAHVFLAALHDAWCEFHPDAHAHHLVFPLLGPELSLDMGSILHALNTALIRRGVAPQTQSAQQAAPTADGDAPSAHAGDAMTQHLHRLFPGTASDVQKSTDRPLPGAFPSLMQEDALQEVAARNELIDYISGIQKNGMVSGPQGSSLLTHIRQSAPRETITQSDAHTIDLLIRIFDVVLNDRNIPAEIVGLIGSLQAPVLKAALLDKNFFFHENHPARRVIEQLTRLSVGWDRSKGPADPTYQTILRNVKRIHSDQRPGVFSEAEADLDSFIRKEEHAAAEAMAAPISQALQQEKLLHATRAAKHEVALRIGTGEVVAFVESFLEDKWVPVLTLAYSVKDEKPQAVDSAVKTMDDLVWSVKPKITAAERKDMLAKLPAIVAMLNKWLDLIKWNDASRAEFFNELARTHASIVRAPLEMSPQRQVEIAIEVAQQATERRLQKQAEQLKEPAPDALAQKVQKLERGSWVEFNQKGGSATRVKLAWVSPMRSLYIFSSRERQAVLSFSAEQLVQKLRDKEARIVLEAGVVGRALAEALGANHASGGGRTAA